MEAGISTATLFLRLNNEDALPLFDEWGVRVAEVFLTSFSEYSARFGALLSTRKGKVRAKSVHVLNTQFEPQLYAEHPRVREDAFQWLEHAMSAAEAFGAERYTFHGIARLKRTFKENLPLVTRRTAEIAEVCARHKIALCYENVEWAFFNRPELFKELKRGCPNLLGVLDLKQARLSGYDWREYLGAMAGSLSHVHASDITSDGKMCLPGRGVLDFDELFARLRDAGFSGPVLIENYQRDYVGLDEVKASYEFLAEKVEKYS